MAGGGFGGGGFGGGIWRGRIWGAEGRFGGGGRGNFRGFDPAQPHGAVFWIGSNSAIDAEPFALRGQPQEQPASGTNRFGITFMSAPYLPHLTKPSGKDSVFLTLSGTRQSSPLDEYATVPTDAERAATFPAGFRDLRPHTFSIHRTASQVIPRTRPRQAVALLKYFPEPNLPGDVQNYHLLSTAQSNTTQAGARYMRSLGKNATLLGGGRGGSADSAGAGCRLWVCARASTSTTTGATRPATM